MTRLNPTDWRSIEQIATQIMVEFGGLRPAAWGRDHITFTRQGESHAYRLNGVQRQTKGSPKKLDYLHVLEQLRSGAQLERIPLPEALR